MNKTWRCVDDRLSHLFDVDVGGVCRLNKTGHSIGIGTRKGFASVHEFNLKPKHEIWILSKKKDNVACQTNTVSLWQINDDPIPFGFHLREQSITCDWSPLLLQTVSLSDCRWFRWNIRCDKLSVMREWLNDDAVSKVPLNKAVESNGYRIYLRALNYTRLVAAAHW